MQDLYHQQGHGLLGKHRVRGFTEDTVASEQSPGLHDLANFLPAPVSPLS